MQLKLYNTYITFIMKQYIDLLNTIKSDGTYKPAARENMPGTQSLFGHQFRCKLSNGFPLLTTKKIKFKNVVTELLWFLRADTNIKYLNDNGFYQWNEDAYNYFCKKCKENGIEPYSFEQFVENIQQGKLGSIIIPGYTLGDCGFQYGRVWRNFGSVDIATPSGPAQLKGTDQIKGLIKSLKNSPEGRRHMVTAVDPVNDTNLALYWCHSLFQFNCRPLTLREKFEWCVKDKKHQNDNTWLNYYDFEKFELDVETQSLNIDSVPRYYLDCQLYQRSADVFLGVPYNIASYALLTHILAKMCNMIPGDYIHTFGDVHIYDNHKEAVELQLSRECRPLPTLKMNENIDWNYILETHDFHKLDPMDFTLEGYDPHPFIKAELSTGMKK